MGISRAVNLAFLAAAVNFLRFDIIQYWIILGDIGTKLEQIGKYHPIFADIGPISQKYWIILETLE